MTIIIRNTSKEPIYEQIKAQIRAAIFEGTVAEGEALPSIRQLARDLKISVITTTRAYNDLEAEGFVASVAGKGFFVLPRDSQFIREQALVSIEARLAEAATLARQAGVTGEELRHMLNTAIKEDSHV